MERPAFFTRFSWAALPLAGLALVAAALLSARLLDRLSTIEIITVIAYPLLVAWAISSFSTSQLRREIRTLRDGLDAHKTDVIRRLEQGRIMCHGTKYNVPSSNEFWNRLLETARYRFYLVGTTNKSWVKKSDDQSSRLGEAILRIVRTGGTVRILSRDDPDIRRDTLAFLERFVAKPIRQLPSREKQALATGMNQRFKYVVCDRSNYNAVLSDDKLLIMPNMNSDAFRAESLVLEMSRALNPQAFDNYLGDIERIFDLEGTHVELEFGSGNPLLEFTHHYPPIRAIE